MGIIISLAAIALISGSDIVSSHLIIKFRELIMNPESTDMLRIIETDSGIDTQYQHKYKQVLPLAPLILSGAALKWYGVYPENQPVPDDITRMAREYLMKTPLEARGLGFVILHRCGEDFYFLIICTWRNSNELWETVFYKNGEAMRDFAPFPRDDVHKPTLCVWELVPVWHEQQAWVRFLTSSRNEAAGQSWLNDCFAGIA